MLVYKPLLILAQNLKDKSSKNKYNHTNLLMVS